MRYLDVTNSLRSLYLILDNRGVIVDINKAFLMFLSKNRGEVVAKNLMKFSSITDENLQKFVSRCKKTSTSLPANIEFNDIEDDTKKTMYCRGVRFAPEDGGEVLVVVECIPKQDSTASFRALNVKVAKQKRQYLRKKKAFDDLENANKLLDKKVMERTQELNGALIEAQEATRTKSEFLSNMSHEIRTPMNGVLGMLDLLLASNLDTQQRDFASTAHVSGEVLLKLLNDILDLSKIEAGKLEFEEIDFSLVKLVEESVSLYASAAQDKGLEITCDLDNELPSFVNGDPTRLKQVLCNLIGNAIKFTTQGEISVVATLHSQGTDNIDIKFAVHDTGIGLEESAVSKIFDDFIQADGSTSRKYGGTGLGLGISKKLVENMNGNIGVKSIIGEGSTFYFTVSLRPALTEHVEPIILDVDFSDINTLIVDDNNTNRMVLTNLLSNWGMRSECVTDGYAAIKAVKQSYGSEKQYNLILLDMMMPGMDGLGVLRELKDEHLVNNTKIIMLTSADRVDLSALAKDLGATTTLPKPVRQSILYDAVVTGVFGDKSVALQKKAMPTLNAPPCSDEDYLPYKLLVVDDNVINQKVALGFLRKLGLDAVIAKDGLEAINMVKEDKFDLVFMDCHMPVMDGYEATQSIRDSEKSSGAHLPIIAMTANVMKGDEEKCLAAGMDDYLGKPLRPKMLHSKLEKWLDIEISVDKIVKPQ